MPRLMVVTDRHRTRGRDLVGVVESAVKGGVGVVQIREKDLSDDELVNLIRRIRGRLTPATPVIVNGRVEVARSEGCGLHLPAAQPRPERAGPAPVGRSAHDLEECRRAVSDAVDYLIVGPVYPTVCKPGHPGSGEGLIRDAAGLAAPLPVYAIGGIRAENAGAVVGAGAWGVAVSGAILSAPEPERAAEAIARAVAGSTGRR